MNAPLLDPASEWASLLAATLADAGVRDVVASPGSRSTPFVLAMAREPRLRLVDLVDERVGGFFALGRARATGRPVALLCTSGTAGAHWFPALIEAAEAGVPLLAITADRPLELQGSRAPQTVDQVKLFGDHVRGYMELGEASAESAALRALVRQVTQATALSQGPHPGPVHLNVRARKPLEPRPATSDEQPTSARIRAARHHAPATYPAQATPSPEGIKALAEALRRARRPLVVCGPSSGIDKPAGEALWSLARAAALPVFAEASSRMRFGWLPPPGLSLDALDLLLESERFCAEPFDLVLQVGEPPVSSAWERLLARHPELERWVVSPWGWRDPGSQARGHLWGDLSLTLRALAQAVQPAIQTSASTPAVPVDPARSQWLERLQRAGRAAWEAERAIVTAEPALSEAAAVRLVASRVPALGRLVLGNSLPIRLVGRHCTATVASCDVLSQRGANGIDGLVSGAAGAAEPGRPTVLLLGDVSLLHDVGGLLAARHAAGPLVVVVLDNGGGRIFEQLPVARSVDTETMRHFTTPHAVELVKLARGCGLHAVQADTLESLDAALQEALRVPQPSLVRVVVPPHGDAQLWPRLRAEVERRVRAALEEPQ